ncbi:MAG: FAD-dependent oxidoreductase, partial [Clostridiales bacterium]|nr:FAD-dependent oxidoreductase [Clostridiales bacterium]
MIYDTIIIGSGPAGLTAAIYAVRAQLSVLVLEKEYMSGGQMLNTYEVDNYPGMPGIGGFELGVKFREHAEKLGVKFVNIEVRHIAEEDGGRVKVLHTNSEEFRARTVVLAMGAAHSVLGVPGEKKLTGMGVSYCATCDGAFFKGQTVAVVGGGDVAAEDAMFLARGCEKVYLIHRRDELRAARFLQEQLKKCENIEFL